MAFDQVISVGYRCHTANHLRRMLLHTISMPFDFIISTPQGVSDAIISEFDGVLQPQNLIPGREYVVDTQFGFQHWHDHANLMDPLADHDAVISKRTFVTTRFFKLLRSRSRLLFIRQEEPNKGSIIDARLIMDAIAKFRPADSFYLLYLSANVSDETHDDIMTINVPAEDMLTNELWDEVIARIHAKEPIRWYSPSLIGIHKTLPPYFANHLSKTLSTIRKRSAQITMMRPGLIA